MPEENQVEVTEVQPVEPVQAEPIESNEPAPEPTPEPTPETETPRDEKGRFKPVQERINELTKARHDAEREAAYWKAQATPKEAPAEKPKTTDFAEYTDYVEALADWKAQEKVAQVMSQRDQEQAKQAESRVQEAKVQTWAERQESVRKAMPDYDTVVGAAEVMLPQHVLDGLLDSDKGPELAYHLAKNPDVAERLASMDQRAADREIGRLEAKLEKPTLVTKPVSNAPEPITPIRGGTAGNVGGDPEKMSPAEFRAWAAKNGSKWIS